VVRSDALKLNSIPGERIWVEVGEGVVKLLEWWRGPLDDAGLAPRWLEELADEYADFEPVDGLRRFPDNRPTEGFNSRTHHLSAVSTT